MNDVGWDIHRGNYESNIYQVDNTSFLMMHGKKNICTSSWIQRGPARACGEWEMGQKSFLAGLVLYHYTVPLKLLALVVDLPEDLTRNRIFTPCGSSLTGGQLMMRANNTSYVDVAL